MNKLIRKFINRETISYLIFGVLTTVVNVVVFQIFSSFMDYRAANFIAWVLSVIFAYVTNMLFVFQSKNMALKVILWEAASFFAARIVSLGFDMGILILCVDILRQPKLVGKLLSQVGVVIINYFFSKLFIFRKK